MKGRKNRKQVGHGGLGTGQITAQRQKDGAYREEHGGHLGHGDKINFTGIGVLEQRTSLKQQEKKEKYYL